ncbi:MAG: type transport system permease protein [Solirubrobacterales bacterium]|nr:type transport system permease protein [Solirubrobacterales bacterium]
MIESLATNARVVAALGNRSIKQTIRRPQLAAPLIIFPTALLAIQTAGAGRAVDLPGFPPVTNFLSFMLAGAIVQAVMMTGNSGAIAFAIDMEMRFTDRLYAAPILRSSVILGRLAATAALGAMIGAYFVVLGLIFGASINEGVPAVLWIILLTSASALAFGSIGAAIALRTNSASVVQGIFPLVFVILFLSDAFFPANLMLEPASWVAQYNPLSFIVNGIREPIIAGWSATTQLKAIASVFGVGALGFALCAGAMRGRLRRGV